MRAGDDAGGRDAFNRASEISLALTIPAAVALMVIPLPLVSVLFERGAFTSDDTAATAIAVAIMVWACPPLSCKRRFNRCSLLAEDTKRPFYYALAAMVLNAALAIGLSPLIGFAAAAIGTTLTGWAMVGMLAYGTHNMSDAARLDDRFKRRLWRIVIAAIGMGAVLLVAAIILKPFFGMATVRYGALLVLVVIGIIAYFGIGQAIGAFKLSEFRRNLRR